MKVEVLHEAGFYPALFGLGLSYGKTSRSQYPGAEDIIELRTIARRLATKDGGHNKFLRQIAVWLDIDAPRFWWSEFDTYKVGTVAQSESTMHTLNKRKLEQSDFEYPILQSIIDEMNISIVGCKHVELIKNDLPEGYLQRRIVSLNYQVLREIVKQRKGHRLPQWKTFIDSILAGVEHPEFLEVSAKAG